MGFSPFNRKIEKWLYPKFGLKPLGFYWDIGLKPDAINTNTLKPQDTSSTQFL